MKTLLIIGAGEIQVPMIKKAKEMGLKTVVTDFDPEAPGFAFADVKSYISTIDFEKVFELAQENKIDGVVTTSDFPVRTVAYVCEKLGLTGLTGGAAQIVTNKYLQREVFRKAGIKTPGYCLIKNEKDLIKTENLNGDIIVKPVDSSASRGVIRIEDRKALTQAYRFALSFSKNKEVIIEEFITGREFSVEVIIQDSLPQVIAITEKFTGGENENFFVEEKHLIPARITKEEYQGVEEAVKKGILAAGLSNSAAHVEVKLSPSGVVIIEMAGRLGGDYITSDLVPLATGVDMLKNVILIALSEKIDTQKSRSCFSGIQFLTPVNYHTILNKYRNLKSGTPIIRSEIKNFVEGKEYKSSLDRLGYFIFCTQTAEEIYHLMGIA